jgi:Zn-dependent M28 family amino/carboxypeptidase
VFVGDEAIRTLSAAPDNTEINVTAQVSTPASGHTYNTVGILRGEDPDHVVLLSAHLDHLGVGQPVGNDSIYNGADDDASGCTAVLELAHALGSGPKPKRTVLFVMFGSEEKGGYGARYWLDHPTVPIDHLVANLEFEMIGRADPKVKPDELWLTGWERSNLGPELAKHGAKLVGDPHPQENFFTRSDNIQLARKGVVAQTVSSYGLHPDYHRPSDDVQHLDFKHMEDAIGSMMEPVKWLVNSDFVPQWIQGGRP